MNLSRRDVLAAGAGLWLSFSVRASGAPAVPLANKDQLGLLHVAPDDTVTVMLSRSEMGQGVWTTLAMLVAEELECDWGKVRSDHVPAEPRFAHPSRNGSLGTGGSSSTRSEFDRYRTVGAMARDMLVRAAAAELGVKPEACTVSGGLITAPTGSRTFGQVAAKAMALEPPATVTLKEPGAWKLIGTRVKRLDTPEKISGAATFGIDVKLDGLRTAVVARAPAFGSTLTSFDATRALAIPGVEKVVQVPSGVAVVARHFWAARQGRDALELTWSAPPGGGLSTDALMKSFRQTARTPGVPATTKGDATAALAARKAAVVAEYEVPYLAHAPMEPLSCTVKVGKDSAEVWTGTQAQTWDQAAAARVLGLSPDRVKLTTTFLGGGFGRRANPSSDFVTEAAHVARAAGVPVKTVWTREDDIRGGFYRPAYVHRVEVQVDQAKRPSAWRHVVVGQSVLGGSPFGRPDDPSWVDPSSVEELGDSPYLEGVKDVSVSLHSPKLPVPVLWWRSVGNTHTAFVMESMIDELAHLARKDPVAYRLSLLGSAPRHAAVHASFRSVVAQVAEVSIEKGNAIRVHRVTCAVDCGLPVNPLGIEAQVEGSVAYGLSATLYSSLNLEGGAVKESNFHDYRVLRLPEMPVVETILVSTPTAPMGGIGEPATAPIAPAVANAVFALTGKRLRTLPLTLG